MKPGQILVFGIFFLIFFSYPVSANFYPGATFMNGNITVTFSENVSADFIRVGTDYVMLDGFNLTVSCSGNIYLNFSACHDNEMLPTSESMLRFNASFSGSTVTFTFERLNTSNVTYYLYTDGVLTATYETDPFTFINYDWSIHDFDIRGAFYPDPPYNPGSVYTAALNTINLTWDRGAYSDIEVLRSKVGSYPTGPTDGTLVQSSTTPYYNFTISDDTYYKIWSLNSSSGQYSKTGLELPWGALTLNVFNASATWQKVDPFGLTIQNVAGDDIYTNPSLSPPVNLGLTDIPIGDNTIFIINASGYKTQTYRRDTVLNTFMNYTFLLPPLETTTPGQGDDDPQTGEPTNETESQLYLITLLNEVDQSIIDGHISFSLYVNETDTYEEVGSIITDGAGQGTIWLVPNKLYKVVASVPGSTDYETNTSYWTPSSLVLTKTFKLKYADDEPQEPYIPQDYIIFTAERTGTQIDITYLDALSQTINTTIYVYEINTTTGTETLFASNTTSGVSSFTYTVNGVNSSNSYRVVLHYNHSIFGGQDPTILVSRDSPQLTTPGTLNTMLTTLIGPNPLIWTHVIMFIILVIGMFYADSQDAGKILIILGGIFIFLNTFIGLDDALTVAAGGIIPGLFIIIGLLIEWNNRKV